MTKNIFNLAADFLEKYAETLGNNSCNDWKWPESFPQDDRKLFLNEDGQELLYDWFIAQKLADLLRNFVKIAEIVGDKDEQDNDSGRA